MSVSRSSFYNSFGGDTKNKFNFNSHRKSSSIAESNFFKWTSGNMYRTSYHDMAKKVSIILSFNITRVNLLSARTWWFQSTKVTFQTWRLTLTSQRDKLSRAEMFWPTRTWMTMPQPWLQLDSTRFTSQRWMLLWTLLQEGMELKLSL